MLKGYKKYALMRKCRGNCLKCYLLSVTAILQRRDESCGETRRTGRKSKMNLHLFLLLPSKSDLIDPFRSWVDWKIKVEAVLVSVIVMPGKPRGIVQTIHNMGALYKHLHHVRDKRMVRTIGITYPQRYSHGLFIPLKQGLKCYTSNKYFKQTLIKPHCQV